MGHSCPSKWLNSPKFILTVGSHIDFLTVAAIWAINCKIESSALKKLVAKIKNKKLIFELI